MKNVICLFAFSAATVVASAQALITGFGTGEFAVDSGNTSATISQNATSLSLTANDQTGTFAGLLGTGSTSVDLTGQLSSISLLATVTTNPASNFSLRLYDASFSTLSFSGNWSQFTTGVATTVVLTPDVVQVGSFNPSAVVGLDLGFGGTGSTVVVSLDRLSAAAVPEPSTYAALVGAAALLFVWKRRRVQVA